MDPDSCSSEQLQEQQPFKIKRTWKESKEINTEVHKELKEKTKDEDEECKPKIIRKSSESTEKGKELPKKKTGKAENHQTIITTTASKQGGRKGNNHEIMPNYVKLKPPEVVFYKHKGSEYVEQMDLESMFEQIKEEYSGDDTEYLEMQPPEDDKDGNIEYKLKLIKTEERRLQELQCQMLRRLASGVDTCYYWMGLEDDGNPLGLIEEEFFLSLKILSHVANENVCDFQLQSVYNGEMGRIGFIKIRQRPRNAIRSDIRIQLMGETGSGKTTLIKTIYNKESCCSEFNKQSTTQVQQQYLCFDSHGELITGFPFTILGIQGEIELATKIISFIDKSGTIRDRKHLIKSYCSRAPNYGLLVLSARNGFLQPDRLLMTQAMTMKMVFFVSITNTDMVPLEQTNLLIGDVKSFIQSTYPEKEVFVVEDQHQIAKIFTTEFFKGNLIPLFVVSSKTMVNIDLFTKFFLQLPDNRAESNNPNKTATELTELTIFNAREKSTINMDKSKPDLIFQGTVLTGVLSLRQKLLIGPDATGMFRSAIVEELIVVETSVERVLTSQMCQVRVLVNLDDKKDFEIRKGQVLVDANLVPRAAWEFIAEITLHDDFRNKVLLRAGFRPVVTFQSIRQSCKIMVTKEDLQGKGYRPLARRKSLQREMTPSSMQILLSIKDVKAIKSSTQGDKMKEQKSLVFSKNLNDKFFRRTQSIDKIKLLPSNEGSGDSFSQRIELAKDNIPVIVIEPTQLSSSSASQINHQLNKFKPEIKNHLRMRFCYQQERIQLGQRFFIDEDNLKAVGVVSKVFY